MPFQLLGRRLKESRAQAEALNYQKKLYRVSEAAPLLISLILSDEAEEDSLDFQEAQQRQEQWEEQATQMLREKEREFNDVGCRKTLNFDKLSELSREVSSHPGADGVEPTPGALRGA